MRDCLRLSAIDARVTVQAATIVVKNEMMTEAHVHALVNLKKENVVVISDKPVNKYTKRLTCVLYQPGWEPQEEVTAKKLKYLWESPQRPHLFFFAGAHYEAYVPNREPKSPKDQLSLLTPPKHAECAKRMNGATKERGIDLGD